MTRIVRWNSGRERQRGQGMSEYIIITALIACAAIGVVSAFGGVVQQQFEGMAKVMMGEDASEPDIDVPEGEAKDLGSWQEGASGGGGGGGNSLVGPGGGGLGGG